MVRGLNYVLYWKKKVALGSRKYSGRWSVRSKVYVCVCVCEYGLGVYVCMCVHVEETSEI